MDSKKIYISRNEYTNKLRLEFDKVLDGKRGLTILKGEAGTGKSCFFASTEEFFRNNNAAVIKSKELQYSSGAAAGITSVIDDIVTNLMLLPKESFEIVSGNYLDAMGSDLISVAEISKKITKAFPSIKYTKHKNFRPSSTRNAIIKFLKVSASILYPLVLFFDDLQWCDELTLSIINELIKDINTNIYLILSFRTNEMDISKLCLRETSEYTDINIENFTIKETKEYISRYLNEKDKNLIDIASAVYTLTNGNIFHIKAILDKLSVEKSSSLKISKIKTLDISYGIKQIIQDRIDNVGHENRHILNVLACISSGADINLLENAIHRKNDIEKSLSDLVGMGMLLKKDSKYIFSHDIIHDYVYSRMPLNYRTQLIKNLIDNLLASSAYKGYSNTIASLCLNADKYELKDEGNKYIGHIYSSAVHSKQSTSFDRALELFELCEYLLDNNDTSSLWLNVQIDYIECLYISENMDEAKTKYHMVGSLCDDKQLMQLDISFLNCYAYSADWENVLILGEKILTTYSFSLTKCPILIDLIYFRYLYRKSNLETIFNAKQLENEKIQNILSVMAAMFPAANRINQGLFTRIVLKLALLTARFGHSEFSGIGYSCAVYLMYHAFNKYTLGNDLQKKTIEYLKSTTQNRSIPYALIGTFTYHWSNPFDEAIALLEKSISYGQIEYEFLYSNYARVFSIITKYVLGESLHELKAYTDNILQAESRAENYLTRYMCRIHLINIECLMTGNESECNIPKDKQAFFDTISLNYQMLTLHRLFITGETRKAYNLAKSIEHKVDEHTGFVLNGDFHFYSALSRMSIYNVLDSKGKRDSLKVIKKHIRDFKKLAKYDNNSHKSKSLLLEAEYIYHIKGRENNEKNYYRAMVYAKKDNNIQMMALANLLAAKGHVYNLKLSKFYAEEAAKLYRQWGAEYIAGTIEKEFSIVPPKADIPKVSRQEYSMEMSEYMSLVASADEDKVAKKMVDLIMNFDGVYRCAVLFEEYGDICVSYDKKSDEEWGVYNKLVNINHTDNLPHGLIRYTFRTQEVTVVNKESSIVLSQDDHVVLSDCSILCIPLFSYDIMVGCVYIECEDESDIDEIKKVVTTFSSVILSKRLSKDNQRKVNETIENDLTNREIEIAQLLNLGLSNEEISKRAFISVGTVRNHISSIYSKLDVSSRVQAVIKLKELGIV